MLLPTIQLQRRQYKGDKPCAYGKTKVGLGYELKEEIEGYHNFLMLYLQFMDDIEITVIHTTGCASQFFHCDSYEMNSIIAFANSER